jgi:uncharacterized protein (DUF2252 family)
MSRLSKTPRPAQRAEILNARRQLKMARSAHAYVRGSTAKFYEWLDTAAGRRLPHGPAVWICGDCHVGNLGPVADARGRVAFQIRDLDQTVIGNPAHDLIRLALSLAMAARSSDLPGVTTARMLEAMIQGYAEAMDDRADEDNETARLPRSVAKLLRQAVRRKWSDLAEERLKDVTPAIPLGPRFWALSPDERRQIETLVATPEMHGLITALKTRDESDAVSLLDAAYWMKGCSSLGRLRYAALAGVGDEDHRAGGLCLLDIKEAIAAAAPRAPNASMPRDNAQRVVEGARHLSPNLGRRMLAARLNDRGVVVRELMPQDLKLDMGQLKTGQAMRAARYLAGVVGVAHARQMGLAARAEWSAALTRNGSKTLDAPSWLWTSVVDLVADHEAAYLEHCRRYALQAAA